MTLENLLLRFHDQYLQIRRIERILISDEFKVIYKRLSTQEVTELEKAIKDLDQDAIEEIISNRLEKYDELGLLSIRKLKEKAKELGVYGYQNLTKALLLSEIVNARKHNQNAS